MKKSFLCALCVGSNLLHDMDISTYHIKFDRPRTLKSSFRALVHVLIDFSFEP